MSPWPVLWALEKSIAQHRAREDGRTAGYAELSRR